MYSLNDKTVLRGGWGIFYTQAFYPGWGGGMSAGRVLERRRASARRSAASSRRCTSIRASRRQLRAAARHPRRTTRTARSILYRPIDANKRPYSHQWNITVDRELGRQLSLSVAYVGSAGRRLPSSIVPLNAIDPSYLSLGDRLNDEFTPGMASLNGVPLPYAGLGRADDRAAPRRWRRRCGRIRSTCSNLQGLNENVGESKYNSLQVKLEKRFSKGMYALVSYTLSKLMESGVRQHAA